MAGDAGGGRDAVGDGVTTADKGARWVAISAFAGLSLIASATSAMAAESVLFIGNSFTYGALSPVWKYRAASVTDLNGGGVGGVPALFKLFANEAKLDYDV